MNRRGSRRAIGIGVAVLVLAAVLAWPAGTWLQGRELQPPAGWIPDAVYLVAGERVQDHRVRGLVAYVHGLQAQDPGARTRVLIGNDTARGPWSREDQRNLSVTEWAMRKIRAQIGQRDRFPCRITPGRYWGTDAEMAALSRFLADMPEVGSVVLVTSPSHVRRAVAGLERHARRGLRIHAVAADAGWTERAPWTVLGELLKITRDAAGLSNAPLISRHFYAELGIGWMDLVLIGCALLLVYAWVLYPLLLRFAAWRRRGRSENGGVVPEEEGRKVVSVDVLISAHNEERDIGERIRNLLETDFPRERLTILVGVDGATDGTAEAARAAAAGRGNVRVYPFSDHRGKAAVLKDLARKAGDTHPVPTDILVFTDANTVFRHDAITRLVRHFDDPMVGGVCGRLVQTTAGSGESQTAEPFYWNWESGLKELESAVDSCLGANGAIYAIRRELFWEDLPANTIVEDFVIGMKVREWGYRMVYEPEAVAEESCPSTSREWRRRVRIGAGDYQAMWLCRRCLGPGHGRFAWMFWSHKALRWFTPHALLAVIIGSHVLLLDPRAGGFAAGVTMVLSTACWLALAAVGRRLRLSGRSRPGFLLQCEHMLMMQSALFVGFLWFCRGGLKGYWERTPRG